MKKILLGDELLIIFARIGDATFGVDIQNVVSIIEPGNVRKVPFAPLYINSILNYYGRIITIFDINTYFKHGYQEQETDKKTIYLRHTDLHIGLLVDAIIRIDYVSPSCIEPVPEEESGKGRAGFSQGIFILEEDAPGIYWLDIKIIEEFINRIEL